VPELKAQLEGTVHDVEQSKQEIAQAEHEVSRAAATNASLHAAYERLRQAAAARPGLIAQQELDDAQAKDLSSEAQVDAAKSALAAAEQHSGAAQSENQRVQALHNYTNVTAPLNGVVIWRYADTGALVQGGTSSNSGDLPIVRISQSNILRLRIPVPENDVKFVHIGDQLDIRVDAIGRSINGRIVRFTREVDAETHSMETEIDVDNKDLSIAPGMYANALLHLAGAENVVTIPVEALVLKGGRRAVFVVDETNHVHLRSVEIGLEGSRLAEVKTGLSPGDRVIIGGQEKFVEGEAVVPQTTAEPGSETAQQTGGTIDMKAEEDGGAH
jgi:RND family efflux transporter MFP subunit